jgi:hypothetical protein
VDRLNFNHCKELFEQIRLAKQEGAVELAEKYVGKLAGGKN